MAAPPVRTVAARTAASRSRERLAFMPPFYAAGCQGRERGQASFGKGSGRTQPDDSVDAASPSLAEFHLSLVRRDEPLDDRQAQP
jgi:hypothetical protein